MEEGKKNSCIVCEVLLKTCDELGDREFCEKLIQDLKEDKITEEQLTAKVIKHFGDKPFINTWDKVVQNVPKQESN